MKAVFISFDQAHTEKVIETLGQCLQRGYTSWEQTQGRGSRTGDPHLGSHAWPGLNASVLTVCADEKVPELLKRLEALDKEKPMLGLRAFVIPVEQAL